MEKIKIIKIGGNIIENEEALSEFLKLFSQIKGPKILVHGGGKTASAVSQKLGIQPRMVEGRRITDEDTLKVVTMVYAGLINKNLVASLQAHNCNAIGLSGADGNAILAHKRASNQLDYGFAGDVDSINTSFISLLLQSGVTPVFCALTHNKQGDLLNTNADTIATELAIALSEVKQTELTYLFEKKGVLSDVEDEDSVIEHLDIRLYQKLKSEQKIFEGMIPKLDSAFRALQAGVSSISIGNMGLLRAEDTCHTMLKLA